MAKKCCVCEKGIGFMDSFTALDDNDKYACNKCYEAISDYVSAVWNATDVHQLDEIQTNAEASIEAKHQDMKSPQYLLEYLKHKAAKKRQFIEDKAQVEQLAALSQSQGELNYEDEDPYQALCEKLVLSTASTLEGYTIKKQLGVVFGETVFKPSIGRQIASDVGDAFRSFSISAKEMKGQVKIIEEARKFAYVKMMTEALGRGANAIIAIDSDNTIGDSICYLSLYGTAVFVEKNE